MDLAQFMAVATGEDSPGPEDDGRAAQFVETANAETLQWLLAQGGMHPRYREHILRAIQRMDASARDDRMPAPAGRIEEQTRALRRRGP